MGRLPDQQPPQFSDQPPSPSPPPPPQGYPNHHDNPLSPPPQEDLYMTENDHSTTPRSYIPENMPPPETYPPQKSTTYPPQQPEAYPPQQPDPVNFPPQQQPDPVSFPPQQQPVNYPPPQQQAPSTPPPQNYNYGYANNGQPQQGGNYAYNNNGQPGYQTPNMNPQNGVPIGNQYMQTQGWKTGLFDCADDMENACITACFPCITFGQIAEILDNGQTSCATSGLLYAVIAALIGIPCIMSCSYRTKMRSRFGLMETPAPDWVTHCFCEWCALCQVYRELKNRGLDPAIGWQGNMVRNQQTQQYPMMAPPMNQRMM